MLIVENERLGDRRRKFSFGVDEAGAPPVTHLIGLEGLEPLAIVATKVGFTLGHCLVVQHFGAWLSTLSTLTFWEQTRWPPSITKLTIEIDELMPEVPLGRIVNLPFDQLEVNVAYPSSDRTSRSSRGRPLLASVFHQLRKVDGEVSIETSCLSAPDERLLAHLAKSLETVANGLVARWQINVAKAFEVPAAGCGSRPEGRVT
jgi:hypothetical protein